MTIKKIINITTLMFLISVSQTIEAQKIKMVMTAAFVSEHGIDIYKDITSYIGDKTGLQVSLISGTSYNEAMMLLEKGIIQVGFVCGLPYTQARAQNMANLIAIPVVAPKTAARDGGASYKNTPGKYYSYTIVHKDSAFTNWQDLKGKIYTFNEITSNSGYNMPRYKLIQLGQRNWNYFSKVIASGSHEESIRMVANKLVDASSVDSLVLDYARHFKEPNALKVKIIETLFPGGAGAPPVIASSTLDPAIRLKIQNAFTQMHEDERGRSILKRALLTRFLPPDDKNYDDIRKMEAAAVKSGFLDFK